LSGNRITLLGNSISSLVGLKVLKLSNNFIFDTKELLPLSDIKLRSLYIDSNPIMKAKNVKDYCVFHIKTLETFNNEQIQEVNRLQAMKRFCIEILNNPSARNKSPLFDIHSSLNKTHWQRNNMMYNKTMDCVNIENTQGCEIPLGDKVVSRNEVRTTLKQSYTDTEVFKAIEEEIKELKEVIEAKKSHLVVLKKQMTEQSIESEADDFCAKEEKASSIELKELESKLKAKEARYKEMIGHVKRGTPIELCMRNITPKVIKIMKCNSYSRKNFKNNSVLLKTKSKEETYDSLLAAQYKVNKEIQEFIMWLINQHMELNKDCEAVISKGNQRGLLSDCNQFYLWVILSFKLIKESLSSSYTVIKAERDELANLLQEKVKDKEYLKKVQSCNLTNGIRSTLKVIQNMEDERVKNKVNKYEAEINNLLEENEELKKRLNNPHTTTIVQRALKLHNYIAEKCEKPIINDYSNPWEVIDSFTKQTRMYIKMAEKNEITINKLKSAKGKFMEYIEKEVNELTKGWNMMEEEKEKLAKRKMKEEYRIETKNKLEKEIEELEKKKEEVLECVNQLFIDEKELKRKVQSVEKKLATLKHNLSDFLVDDYKPVEESQCKSLFERTLNSKKKPLKEWNDDTFEYKKKHFKENGRRGKSKTETKCSKLSKSIEAT